MLNALGDFIISILDEERLNATVNSPAHGGMELHPRGHGFLRNPPELLSSTEDADVPAGIIQKTSPARGGCFSPGPIEGGGSDRGHG